MKTTRLLLSAVAGLALSSPVFAATPAKTSDSTEVIFSHPEKFADVRDAYMGTDEGRDAILSELKDYIVDRAKSRVPSGSQLTVTVTDVDLAGDFEPWHGADKADIRVVKDIYPPKIDLEFKLTGADGKVLKEGRRKLRDLAFLMKLTGVDRQDHLRFEKALIDDWLRADFPRAKAS